MKRGSLPGSLGWRVLLGLVAGEIAFAIVLGITMGVFTAVDTARQRSQTMGQISSVIAAGLMPVVADQEAPQIKAQMSGILQAAQAEEIECLRIEDSSGSLIASSDESGTCVASQPKRFPPPLTILLDRQVVQRPVVVSGLRIATVYVAFNPPGVASLLRGPGLAAALVLLSVVLISGPWTAWAFSRTVTEPLGELGRDAARIADGDLEVSVHSGGLGEIGELQRALADMASQLSDRRERLDRSYAELSEAYSALGEAKHDVEQLAELKANFVAVAGHEIRSPLATIALYAELLDGGELAELDDAAVDAARAIAAASSRLTSIVSDLMDSALLERGLMPIEFGDVWLGELLDHAVRDARSMARSRGIEIRLEDAATTEAVIRADGLRLRQVLDNLLSNALKYSPEDTEVVVRTEMDAEFVEIEVADQGRGVSQSDQHVLFTLFGRVDSADGRDTAGLGLGLAISARIVQAHGGSLTFRENEEGRGSVFCVKLPVTGPRTRVPRTMVTFFGEGTNG